MGYLTNPFIFATSSTGPIISAANLKVYFKFEGDVLDQSGNALNGSVTGPLTYTSSGKYSSGATFPSAPAAYVSLSATTYGIANNYSLACWIKTTATSQQQIFSSDKNGGGTRRVWQFRLDGTGDGTAGLLRFVRFNSSNGLLTNIANSTPLNTGNWVHVAATFDSAKGSYIYVNGVSAATDTVLTANNNPADAVPILGTYQGVGTPTTTTGSTGVLFIGTMDEVLFFNRTLTPSEVSILASSSTPFSGT
jgi:hypothetical protein